MTDIIKSGGSRIEKRVLKNLTISVRYDEKVYSGITQNISKNGLYIETIGLPLNPNIDISIIIAGEDALYRLEGEIVWEKKIKSGSVGESLNGLGVKLISVPSEYINLVEYEKHK